MLECGVITPSISEWASAPGWGGKKTDQFAGAYGLLSC